MKTVFRKNIVLWVTLLALAIFFFFAARGMETKDWAITLLRGLSVGSVTFLVASGFSLIFGLLDVLNLAHGTLFMIGAYIAWTVYVRPDTFVDLLTPVLLLVSGFLLSDVWSSVAKKLTLRKTLLRLLPWLGLTLSAALLIFVLPRYPITIWDVGNYAQSPVTFSFMADQGMVVLPPGEAFEAINPLGAVLGLLAASVLGAFSFSLFGASTRSAPMIWAESR